MIHMTRTVVATMYLDKTNQWEPVNTDRRNEALQHITTGGFTQMLAQILELLPFFLLLLSYYVEHITYFWKSGIKNDIFVDSTSNKVLIKSLKDLLTCWMAVSK